MGKRGIQNNQYKIEIKLEAVRLVLEEGMSYRAVAQHLGVRNKSQIEAWIKRYKEEKSFEDERRLRPPVRPGNFNSIEEELEYYKMENAYLKKRNPNLHGEGSWENRNASK